VIRWKLVFSSHNLTSYSPPLRPLPVAEITTPSPGAKLFLFIFTQQVALPGSVVGVAVGLTVTVGVGDGLTVDVGVTVGATTTKVALSLPEQDDHFPH